VQCEHFTDKEGLQVRMSALFGAKKFEFLEIYDVSAWIMGEMVEPVWRICRQGGRGQFFATWCGSLICFFAPLKRNFECLAAEAYCFHLDFSLCKKI